MNTSSELTGAGGVLFQRPQVLEVVFRYVQTSVLDISRVV